MTSVSPPPDSGDDTLGAVEVRPLDDGDENAVAEAGVIKNAMRKLQRLVCPTPLLDLEVESRRSDATRVLKTSLSKYQYRSSYHDAHQTTLVSVAASLTRALGDGPVGSGFGDGAEQLVRDATYQIANAARNALTRDQGELPRLFDIACKLKQDRDDARHAVRGLVLAFGRERAGLGERQKRRVVDATNVARDEAMRAGLENTNDLLMRQQRHEEELGLLHLQLTDARDAPARQINALTRTLASERSARGLALETHLRAINRLEAERDALHGANLLLRNQLSGSSREVTRVTQESFEKLQAEQTVRNTAVSHAMKCREAVGTSKRRQQRGEAFRLWRLRARLDIEIRDVKLDAKDTVRTIKNGYELQIERTQHLCDLAVQRANKRVADAEQKGSAQRSGFKPAGETVPGGSLAPSERLRSASTKPFKQSPEKENENENDPWCFLSDAARERDAVSQKVGDAKRVAREKAAIEAAERQIEKVDAYYERVRQREAKDTEKLLQNVEEKDEAGVLQNVEEKDEAMFLQNVNVSPHETEPPPPPSPAKALSMANKARALFLRDEATAAAAAVLVQGAVARVVLGGEDFFSNVDDLGREGVTVDDLVREGRLVSRSSITGEFDSVDTVPAAVEHLGVVAVDTPGVTTGSLNSEKSEPVVEELTRASVTSVTSIAYSADFDEDVE